VRAVLDVNVLVSALFASGGSPARLLRAWRDGMFDLVVSPLLLEELSRALTYDKVRSRIRPDRADRFVKRIRASSTLVEDPVSPPTVRSRDPGDDYLIALAASTRSILVTGDTDLLALAGSIPVESPREFLGRLPPQA
jgi:putative PIN family toxin of toxin-antitoxin system